MYNFKCPYCSTGLDAEDNYIGKCINCPVCSETVVVPDKFMPAGTEFGGYIIQDVVCSNMLWTTYHAIGITKSFGKTVMLRVPTTFIKNKPVELYKAFSNMIRITGTVCINEFPELIESSVEDDIPFFVYESYPNGSVLSNVNVSNHFSNSYDSLRLIRKITVALKKLWDEQNTIVQSLKPSNICYYGENKIQILDLGLSQFALQNPELLEFGLDVWDQAYTAPELIETGQANTPSSDIYSLAGVLFYLLTGRDPSEESSENSITVYNDSVPDSINALFKRMSQKNIEDRPSNHKELLREIDKILKEEAPEDSGAAVGQSYHETSTMAFSMSSIKDELKNDSSPGVDLESDNDVESQEEDFDDDDDFEEDKKSLLIPIVVVAIILLAVAVFMFF